MSARASLGILLATALLHPGPASVVEQPDVSEAFDDIVSDLRALLPDPPAAQCYDDFDSMTPAELQAGLSVLGRARAGDAPERSLRREVYTLLARRLAAKGHEGVAPQPRSFGRAWAKASLFLRGKGSPDGADHFEADLIDLGFNLDDMRLPS